MRDDPAKPVRRVYAPASGRRDVDAFERVTRFRVFGWSIVGAFLGLLLGLFLGVQGTAGAGVIALTTFLGWAGSYFGPLFILRGAGRAGSVLHSPSGSSTPRKKEYSLAQSYVARGMYDEAVAAYDRAISEDPKNPEPYLRVARLKRDSLDDPEGAATWFKRALAESDIPAGVILLTRKELIEVYELRLNQPHRAAPLLARIAEESAGTPDGKWASQMLALIKSRIATEREEA